MSQVRPAQPSPAQLSPGDPPRPGSNQVVVGQESLFSRPPKPRPLESVIPWQFPARPGRLIPRDAILWLGEGDVLATADDSRLVLITAGGQLGAGRPGGTYFVQRNGALAADRNGEPVWIRGTPGALGKARAERGEGGIYFEPGAILPEEFRKAPLGHATPAIVPSFFDQEFVILPGPLFRPRMGRPVLDGP